MRDEATDYDIQDVLEPLGNGINVTTARQELAERIVAAITIGAYSPGEQLPSERELAEKQGVSRVTVRGALEIVRDRGLLVSKRGRGGGTFVAEAKLNQTPPDAARRMLEDEIPRLRSFVDFRCLIAGLEARTAAERRTDEQARRLTRIMEQFNAADDTVEARKIDVELHMLITAMAANEQLAKVTAQLSQRATMGLGAEPYPKKYLERARQEHSEIVESIVKQDLERAFRAAHKHFSLTLEIMEEAFSLAERHAL